MYSPFKLNQVFSLYDYVNIMDHFGKLMELNTKISMAAIAKACRLVDQHFLSTLHLQQLC